MTVEVQFTIDNDLFQKVFKAGCRFTETRPGIMNAHFDQEGFHLVGKHPADVSAILISVNKKLLTVYKRKHDKDKETQKISQDFMFTVDKLEDLITFANINRKEPLNIKITDKNIIIKMGELKKTVEHGKIPEEWKTSGTKIENLLERLGDSIPHVGTIPSIPLTFYVRESEAANRKHSILIIDSKASIIKKKGTFQLYMQLGTDEMICEMKDDIEDAPKKNVKATIDIREMGQAMKHVSKLTDKIHLQLLKDNPSILSSTGKNVKEGLYEDDISFWYLLAPLIEDDE